MKMLWAVPMRTSLVTADEGNLHVVKHTGCEAWVQLAKRLVNYLVNVSEDEKLWHRVSITMK